MKFLDLNGLNHFWTKIKASFGTAIVESFQSSNIPFVANHQIINVNSSGDINVYDWFQKASKEGILEIFLTSGSGSHIYCKNQSDSFNYLYKMRDSQYGPMPSMIDFLEINYNTYARLIKINNNNLIVAEFVQNK